MTNPSVDLRQLARERPDLSEDRPARRSPWMARYVLPVGILAGFLILLGFAMRDYWMPRLPVTVVPVMTSRGILQRAGTPLFQAAGWIEPRPSAVQATSLAEGIVAEILVVEGQWVDAGDAIARLIDIDAHLALRKADAVCALRKAELQSAAADLIAAQSRWEQPVHLQAELADAQAAKARIETELSRLPFMIATAEAELALAESVLNSRLSAQDAVPGRLVHQAKNERDSAQASLDELKERIRSLTAERHAQLQRVEALDARLTLRVEEARAMAEAEAAKQAAEARLQEAEVALEHAQLILQRMTIGAPISGRILKLLAQPGTSLQGLDPSGGHNSSAIATMYDPARLQVRADVRLEDFPMVQSGQPVQIETASVQSPMLGSVLQATSSANIQKNTVEVKVGIDEAPAEVRPEMLVTVTFLAPETPQAEEPARETLQILVPRRLIEGSGESASIWVVGEKHRAEKRTIQLGAADSSEWVQVTSGLNPTDKLISSDRSRLRDGTLIRVAFEASADSNGPNPQ